MKTQVTLPDGSIKEFKEGSSAMDVAQEISKGLARNVLSAKVNGEIWDASRTLPESTNLELISWVSPEGKQTFWHSSAHIMAEALEQLYPGVKLGIGPAIQEGFYYDIDTGDQTISSDDFKKIEDKMLELARQRNAFSRKSISKADAIAYFKEKGDEYKLELLKDLEDGTITFYKQGNFVDLCRGPHIPNTGKIKAVKIMKVAGAYWRGDENRKQLTRLYGISFPKQKELTEYLELLEEAKKRDHRKIGAELDLFMFSEKVGGGLPIWLPKGTALRNRLTDYLRDKQMGAGYQEVITPHIGKKELYVTSGHYAKYGKDSFQPITTPKEGEEYLLKPMNCPHHCEIYGHRPHSYKELPIRISEFGTVYRYEQSGELHGLSRVRGFTQDDAHIFCTNDQVQDEFLKVLDLTKEVLARMGFDSFEAQISLRDPDNPDKYLGSKEDWDVAEKAVIDATEAVGLETTRVIGEAAFYGPKLDFMIKDALNRSWQLGTIQVDYNLPKRFGLEYIGADNSTHTPVMIHRAPFGSLERFVSILIEHTAGKFPLWLTPDQYALLPINDSLVPHCEEIAKTLAKSDIRGFIDDRTESIGRKIRDTELKKVPIMLIVGEKEKESNTVSVRIQGDGDKGSMKIGEFVEYFGGLL